MFDDQDALFPPKPPASDRSFGFAIAGLLTLFGLLPALAGHPIRVPVLVAAALVIAAALICPALLEPVHRLFVRVGAVLQKIVSPIIVTLLFVLVVLPFGIARRIVEGRRKPASPQSYWKERDLVITPASFRQQF